MLLLLGLKLLPSCNLDKWSHLFWQAFHLFLSNYVQCWPYLTACDDRRALSSAMRLDNAFFSLQIFRLIRLLKISSFSHEAMESLKYLGLNLASYFIFIYITNAVIKIKSDSNLTNISKKLLYVEKFLRKWWRCILYFNWKVYSHQYTTHTDTWLMQ